MVKRINREIKERIIKNFNNYKNKEIRLKDIADKFNVSISLISLIYKKEFGDKYRIISKQKSFEHNTKINLNQINEAFRMYKEAMNINEISTLFNLRPDSLKDCFRKHFGNYYRELSKNKMNKREYEGRKVHYNLIKETFQKYKNNKIPLSKLAEELGIAESSLTTRFLNHFKGDYKKIAKSRRDERKVTKEDYEKAFDEYCKTGKSLSEISKKLGISIGSLRPRFIRLFGDRYNQIAKEKMDSNFLIKRGEVAEKLALEYLKIIRIDVEDVRKKCLIKGSLKRPDFIVGENFIEIKSYFVKYSNKKYKGYKEILESYLNKELIDGGYLKFGIIISLGGFSEKVWLRAIKDNVTLVDKYDLIRRFKENDRQDLMELVNNYF